MCEQYVVIQWQVEHLVLTWHGDDTCELARDEATTVTGRDQGQTSLRQLKHTRVGWI